MKRGPGRRMWRFMLQLVVGCGGSIGVGRWSSILEGSGRLHIFIIVFSHLVEKEINIKLFATKIRGAC